MRWWHRWRARVWMGEYVYQVGYMLDIKPGSFLWIVHDHKRKRAALFARFHRVHSCDEYNLSKRLMGEAYASTLIKERT